MLVFLYFTLTVSQIAAQKLFTKFSLACFQKL